MGLQAGKTYRLVLLLDVCQSVHNIIFIIDVVTRNSNATAGTSENQIDQIGQRGEIVLIVCTQPPCNDILRRITALEDIGLKIISKTPRCFPVERVPYNPSASLSAIATRLPPFFGRAGNFTARGSSRDDVPLTLAFFAAGFLFFFAFLLTSRNSSSAALSTASSLASASSSISDASFSPSSSVRFLFEFADPACDEGASGANFSGAFTARPDLRLLPVAAGELVTSLLEMSMSGGRRVVIEALTRS